MATTAASDFLGCEPIGAFSHRIRVALEHDQRGGAGRMCCREQRRCRERAVDREEDRFATPEIVQHRGDAVGPLLQGRQRARRDGIGRSGARLVEEDRADRAMSSPRPTLEGTVAPEGPHSGEPVRDEHDVARTFSATRDRRRASPRSAHSASPRTLRLRALPLWKKREMLANIKYVDANFGGDGGLFQKPPAGEAD